MKFKWTYQVSCIHQEERDCFEVMKTTKELTKCLRSKADVTNVEEHHVSLVFQQFYQKIWISTNLQIVGENAESGERRRARQQL